MRHLEDRPLLLDAVREAGAVALKYFRDGVKSWNKQPNDPVSEADIAIDKLLRARLVDTRPGYGWLSEESASAAAVGDAATWVVDPIDGTRAFIAAKPEFAVSVALMAEGQPVLAAIFNPATDEFFEAATGDGAKLNGKTIRASGHGTLAEARLLASRRTFDRHGWLARTGKAEFEHRNSIAYRMALVAAGRFDAALSLSEKSDWDIAAADLVVREAGGRISTADGAPLRYDAPRHRHPSVIATGPWLHDELVDLLKTRKRDGHD
ncbi:3'(2'),5'-bisphosphate nucleotidase CysQ [Ferrovibrio sp. MS7]|uniref:inositol monophosphatase family protein n=1 Tax=Ferrovibrio plantarum TaxID=3119164 RepID=UPI003134A908